MKQPGLVLIVGEDLIVERTGLYVGDVIEVDVVKIGEGGELVAVDAGGSGARGSRSWPCAHQSSKAMPGFQAVKG